MAAERPLVVAGLANIEADTAEAYARAMQQKTVERTPLTPSEAADVLGVSRQRLNYVEARQEPYTCCEPN